VVFKRSAAEEGRQGGTCSGKTMPTPRIHNCTYLPPQDFKVGHSPERINPGDKVHRLETIVKIVSGMDKESLDTIAKVYKLIVEAGVLSS
jgi:UDP-N-acetyl-D-mannosaminuronate dehydrogenase